MGGDSQGQDDVLSESDWMIVDPNDAGAIPSQDETFEAGIFDGEVLGGDVGNADDSDDDDDEADSTRPKGKQYAYIKV